MDSGIKLWSQLLKDNTQMQMNDLLKPSLTPDYNRPKHRLTTIVISYMCVYMYICMIYMIYTHICDMFIMHVYMNERDYEGIAHRLNFSRE